MKKINTFWLSSIITTIILYSALCLTGCGQIGAPTGGLKDTIPPRLVKAVPENRSTNFRGNKVTLQFDEYINLDDIQNNVLISPYQSNTPQINFNFRTVTVKFRDSLAPNTTYTINFGNAIRDLNENNPLQNFAYIFSTGPILDSLSLSGIVILAENGNTDSTIIVSLYTELSDSAFKKTKPKYISRLDGDGRFIFENLPPATYTIFSLKDGDNSRTYNSKSEIFGFIDSPIILNKNISGIQIFASVLEKPVTETTSKTGSEKKLTYTTNLVNRRLDILQPLKINFNRPLKNFQDNLIRLTDSTYKTLSDVSLKFDSTAKAVSLQTNWIAGSDYILIIQKDITDSLNNSLPGSDTLKFNANSKEAYGRVLLRFTNVNFSLNPVLQLLQGDKIMISAPLSGNEWRNNLVLPSDYDIRILYDANKNGIWDPGNYDLKKQPERSVLLKMKLSVKADWDNEIDIKL